MSSYRGALEDLIVGGKDLKGSLIPKNIMCSSKWTLMLNGFHKPKMGVYPKFLAIFAPPPPPHRINIGR